MTPIVHKAASLSFQPRIRKGAFFEAAWRHGCRQFSVYNRTFITSTFRNPTDEYWNVVQAAAIWPVMGERQVEISGPDAARFVQYLTPRDMSRCDVGQCKYALVTSASGGIIGDPIVLKFDENRFWLSTADSDLELWAKGVAVNAQMDVSICDAQVSVIQVQGPKSPVLMVDVFGSALLDLPYYRHMPLTFGQHELRVSRTGWSGEFGYEIYLQNAAQGDALFDALIEAGKAVGAGPGAVNQARRIESGILSWGVDMNADDTPFDIGLGRLVELDATPDFVGRAALVALRDAPQEKKLVGLRVAGAQLDSNEDIWPLWAEGQVVGKLTSMAYSPRLASNIALGVLPVSRAEAGSEIQVMTCDGWRTAMVSDLPFLPKRQNGDPRALFDENSV